MAKQSKIEYSKEYLTSEELAAISKVKLPLSRQRKARDIFLFSCFTVLALINNHLIVSVLRGATN